MSNMEAKSMMKELSSHKLVRLRDVIENNSKECSTNNKVLLKSRISLTQIYLNRKRGSARRQKMNSIKHRSKKHKKMIPKNQPYFKKSQVLLILNLMLHLMNRKTSIPGKLKNSLLGRNCRKIQRWISTQRRNQWKN